MLFSMLFSMLLLLLTSLDNGFRKEYDNYTNICLCNVDKVEQIFFSREGEDVIIKYNRSLKQRESEYKNLANAIIVEASRDYRTARRILSRNPGNLQARYQLNSTIDFFESQWYEALTVMDGKELLRKLEEEIA